MYLELLKRFEGGKTLKTLHPINDMEIEFDAETDQQERKTSQENASQMGCPHQMKPKKPEQGGFFFKMM